MRCFISFALLLLILPVAGLATPVEDAGDVVQEVIRMLEADVSERIVGRWLDASGKSPDSLSSGDLIALTEAGASEELIERLLSTVRPVEPAVEKPDLAADEAPAAPATPPAEEPEITAHAAEIVPPPVAEPVAVDSEAAVPEADALIDTYFKILYRSSYDEFEEGTRPWDLFVYMDGQYLAWVKVNKKEPVEFFRRLSPGSHRFVVMQQRHELKSEKSGVWRHEFRVSPAPLDVDLDAGSEMEIEISFQQDWMERKGRGPLSIRTLRKRTEIDNIKQVGTPAAFWPGLCEEETKRGKCLGWAGLWPQETEPADWGTLQAAAEEARYAPPPAADRVP